MQKSFTLLIGWKTKLDHILFNAYYLQMYYWAKWYAWVVMVAVSPIHSTRETIKSGAASDFP